MKNLKWLGWTLVIVLVAAGVGFAGFQLGAAQGANLGWMTPFMHGRGFDGDMMRGGFHGHDFDGGWGFPSFLFPFWGILRLAFFAGLVWLGYALFKRSGWRLVNVNQAPAAVTDSE